MPRGRTSCCRISGFQLASVCTCWYPVPESRAIFSYLLYCWKLTRLTQISLYIYPFSKSVSYIYLCPLPCLEVVNLHGDSKVAKYNSPNTLLKKPSDSGCWKGMRPPAYARWALEIQRHCSHVSLWPLTTRQLMHSVPTAGASGRSLTIALSKGHWGNPGWRSPTDGKLWWDSHWWGERRGYSFFAKSSVAGSCAQAMISIANAVSHWGYLSLGEKQVPILSTTLSTLPKCALWGWFHIVVMGNFLIWNNYFRDKNAFKKINEWWSLMHWNHPGARRSYILLFQDFQVEREDGQFLNLTKICVL